VIYVHIMQDPATFRYADYAQAAMTKLASQPDQLEFERVRVQPDSFYQGTANAARRHSLACELAFKATEHRPDAVHVICDSDTVVVKQGWDELVSRILDEIDCFGTAYQDIGCRFSRSQKLQTYKGKPNVQWLALKPGIPWSQYSVGNKQLVDNFTITSPEQSDTFGLPTDYQLLTDTCWNFPLFLYEHGLSSMALPNVNVPKLVGRSYEEWWYYDEVFVVHQGKSRKHEFRRTSFSDDFYRACDAALGYV